MDPDGGKMCSLRWIWWQSMRPSKLCLESKWNSENWMNGWRKKWNWDWSLITEQLAIFLLAYTIFWILLVLSYLFDPFWLRGQVVNMFDIISWNPQRFARFVFFFAPIYSHRQSHQWELAILVYFIHGLGDLHFIIFILIEAASKWTILKMWVWMNMITFQPALLVNTCCRFVGMLPFSTQPSLEKRKANPQILATDHFLRELHSVEDALDMFLPHHLFLQQKTTIKTQMHARNPTSLKTTP